MDRFDLGRLASVPAEELDIWIAEGWLLPRFSGSRETFREIDLARAQLIVDLRRDLGVNDEAVPVILDLIDQICALRSILQPLLRGAAAATRLPDESQGGPRHGKLVFVMRQGRFPMSASTLPKSEWSGFFANLSRTLQGKQAEIEVLSLDLGDQIAAEWLPLLGIAYDPKNDVVEVALQGVDHMIRTPKDIYVDVGPVGLLTIEVTSADETREIIKFRDPLMLPAPH
jgi:hypothetical protein